MLSTGYIVEDISKVARARGGETYVAYGRKSVKGINREIKIGNILSSIEHYLESRLFDNEGLASRFATYRLIGKITALQPDIVHLHNIHDHYLNYRMLFNYLNKTDIKVVWTFHDFWAITGHCHHFIDAFCNKWQTACNNCPLQHSTVNSLVDKSSRNFLLKKSIFTGCKNLTVVPVSYWVGDMVKQSFLRDCKIQVIPNGIDLSINKPVPGYKHSLISDSKFVILAVARDWNFGDRKGLDEYIKLSKMLKEDELIVLVGMTSTMAKQMPSNIIGVERIYDKNLLLSLYTRANVLLSLSSAETFGLTLVEAMACGTPVVVYNNTAPPAIVVDGVGYVARDKDINDVYDKISILRQTDKTNISKNCQEHVRKLYNKEVNYSKYVDLYEQLVAAR